MKCLLLALSLLSIASINGSGQTNRPPGKLIDTAATLELARYLADSIIIVVSSSVIDVPAGPLAPQATSRQTFIVVNKGRIWQIQHWHNTPIRSR